MPTNTTGGPLECAECGNDIDPGDPMRTVTITWTFGGSRMVSTHHPFHRTCGRRFGITIDAMDEEGGDE